MRVINTYDRFHRHIRAWADGHIDCLLTLGDPGFGKTSSYEHVLGNRPYHQFRARKSALQVYCDLYDAPTLPVVLDDVGNLLKDDNFIDMLKSLCETGKKTIRWGTTTPKLGERKKQFSCTSTVLIVLNRIPEKNADIRAILDRCDTIEFRPTKTEVMARMRDIFPDDGHLIDLLAEQPVMPTLRTLIHARQWARSDHLDLLEELFAECGVPKPISDLVDIMHAHPRGEWCSRYIAVTGLTDRTFRRHKAIASELLSCSKSA